MIRCAFRNEEDADVIAAVVDDDVFVVFGLDEIFQDETEIEFVRSQDLGLFGKTSVLDDVFHLEAIIQLADLVHDGLDVAEHRFGHLTPHAAVSALLVRV